MAAPNTIEGSYGKPTNAGLVVRADMLESIAGFEDIYRLRKELSFAIGTLDEKDPDSLRWLACLASELASWQEQVDTK